MPDYKRYGIAAATMATILVTGQVMQMSSANKRASVAEVQAMPLPVELSDIELTASDQDEIVTAALDDTLKQNAGTSQPKAAECQAGMTAFPKAAAVVNIALDAPCQPNERVVIHHNGMMFSDVTDARGQLEISVPALSEQATFIASFASGEGAVATAVVEELRNYDRAVVQMQGNSGIGLHAREFGAEYGSAGHIWAEQQGEIVDGVTGHGGFLVSLGDATLENPLVAEVYSFPSAMAKEVGEVTMSVDIEITEANCDNDIEAQTLQLSRGGQLKVQSLDVSMPACDAVGDFLLLKNLVNDMKVAFN